MIVALSVQVFRSSSIIILFYNNAFSQENNFTKHKQIFPHTCKKQLNPHTCAKNKKLWRVKGRRESQSRWNSCRGHPNESVLIYKDQVKFQKHQNIFRSSIISLNKCIFHSHFWSIIARFQSWFKLGKEQCFNCFDGNTIRAGVFFIILEVFWEKILTNRHFSHLEFGSKMFAQSFVCQIQTCFSNLERCCWISKI